VKIVDDRQDKTTLRSFSNEDGSTAVFGRLDKVFAGRDAAAIHEQNQPSRKAFRSGVMTLLA